MKLAHLLDLNVPLPKDPFDALYLTRRRLEKLNKRTIEVMTAAYPDYVSVVSELHSAEEKLASSLGSFGVSIEGEA